MLDAYMGNKISVFSLVWLIVAAIDSIRNLPAMALFGSSLFFFFFLSAFLFLIPVALLSAEFASRYPEEGGVFHWVRHAFGEKAAFMAVWLQWINTVVWYPTILAFIAGTAAYLIHPSLAQNKGFLIAVILIAFWGLTFLNMYGIRISAKINEFCGIMGTVVPMLFLIALGLLWGFSEEKIHISFAWHSMVPSLNHSENWVSLIAIMAAFLGMELSGVYVNDIKNPQKTFPRAMGIAVIILLTTQLFGALSIATVIPESEIRLVDGIMQTFTYILDRFHLLALRPWIVCLIIIGSLGGMINWLLSPAKGLLQASRYDFLPRYFSVENRWQVPYRILIAQAILMTGICVVILILPSINAFYWFLMALSTGLYMIMYMFIFASGLKLGRAPKDSQVFQIPRGSRHIVCCLGLFGCAITIFVGFFPPSGVEVGSSLRYCLMIAGGNIALILPAWLLCQRKRLGRR